MKESASNTFTNFRYKNLCKLKNAPFHRSINPNPKPNRCFYSLSSFFFFIFFYFCLSASSWHSMWNLWLGKCKCEMAEKTDFFFFLVGRRSEELVRSSGLGATSSFYERMKTEFQQLLYDYLIYLS